MDSVLQAIVSAIFSSLDAFVVGFSSCGLDVDFSPEGFLN
jgi:hypothetical protein